MATSTEVQLREQWISPSDILSLLLLIGGDIIQKAIAQLVGHSVRVPGSKRQILVTPVAFSFGWVAYSFSNLLATFGDMKLMPSPGNRSLLVNCSNGFVRENASWVLERLLRDHELRHEVDPRTPEEGGREESIRIDIFNLGPITGPKRDFVWWFGWLVILIQINISIVPLIVDGDWTILMITICGTFFAAISCAMPQWKEEKWPASKPGTGMVTCLTRGNGHRHVMVFIGAAGSWNFEALATGASMPRSGTRWISLLFSLLWTGLLISVSGSMEHPWYLVSIGGVGMLQNLFAAATPRLPETANIHLSKFSRAPTIIGRRVPYRDQRDVDEGPDLAESSLDSLTAWVLGPEKLADEMGDKIPMPAWLESMSKEDGVPAWLEPIRSQSSPRASRASTGLSTLLDSNRLFLAQDMSEKDNIYATGVHGALMELEKWVPTAGLAMVQVLFPNGLEYHDAAIRENAHKRFWKNAYATYGVRKKGEIRRRQQAQTPEGSADTPVSC